jgi:hypothetical protein
MLKYHLLLMMKNFKKCSDPCLVQVVEELGNKACGSCSCFTIVELPKGTKYYIVEYDGFEHIETIDDIKWLTA